MSNWNHTRAEKKVIGDAAAAARYLCEHHIGLAQKFDAAIRHERRERSCLTTAKALVVESFLKGMEKNPTARELAYMSDGCASAAILGARCSVAAYDPQLVERFVGLASAAALRHSEYIQRGLSSIH